MTNCTDYETRVSRTQIGGEKLQGKIIPGNGWGFWKSFPFKKQNQIAKYSHMLFNFKIDMKWQ